MGCIYGITKYDRLYHCLGTFIWIDSLSINHNTVIGLLLNIFTDPEDVLILIWVKYNEIVINL